MTRRQWLILLTVVALAAAFWFFDLGHWLRLETLKARQTELRALYDARPLTVIAVYMAVYVTVTALSLPGAVILTLAGGALFGLWTGLVVVSLASTAGATLAFLAARYLLRDSVTRRFGARLDEVHRGMDRNGAFYLFTLRLVPLVPFFVINLVMGLTKMPARRYAWVSQLGMLPGTLVYVNAGTALGGLQSLSGIVSPQLLGAFALLAVFPWIARAVLGGWQARRVQQPWAAQRPKQYDRNLVVIGAGAAGLVTSYIAAAVRAKVTLVEAHQMGGDCLNTGCVPSKALIRAAKLAHEVTRANEFGLTAAPATVDFAAVMDRVADAVRGVAPHDSVERYTALGVDVRQGHARLVDPWHVEITAADGTREVLSTRAIVIATGAAPTVPPLPGLQDVAFLTSDTLWGLRTAPRRLAVLGGGPIGCELALALARLGCGGTLVGQAPRLLAREDGAVSALAADSLRAAGVDLRLGVAVQRAEASAAGAPDGVLQLADGAAVAFDRLLVAVGRSARLQGFGLEALGIPAGRTIETNEYLETLHPNIYACGDVAGPWQFTHAAGHQAWSAAVNALFGQFRRFRVDGRVMPAVTFLDPEIARVGLNEREAAAQGVAVEVTRYPLGDLDRAIVERETTGFIQVLTEPGRDRMLGVTIVGAHAGELLAEFTLAMQHGLGLNKILGTVHPYPSWSDAAKLTAGRWKDAHKPEGALRWLARYHAWRRGG
ncbi:FAD-dependent oxidoreductase [Sphaerotilus montanus]|uniref:FAD-dependent oxidoreductase n=1 Tax=Sphaerotilus montanus TaxID=522889 RepID=UPI003FA2F463